MAPQVTWDNLCAHVSRYGLDNESKGYSIGKPKTYTSYKQFRNDSAVEVARRAFGPDTYATFVEKYGQHGWVEEARKDHKDERAEAEAVWAAYNQGVA